MRVTDGSFHTLFRCSTFQFLQAFNEVFPESQSLHHPIFVPKVKECAEKAEVSAAPSIGGPPKPAAAAAATTSTDGGKKDAPGKKPAQKQAKPAAKAGESAKPGSSGGVSINYN